MLGASRRSWSSVKAVALKFDISCRFIRDSLSMPPIGFEPIRAVIEYFSNQAPGGTVFRTGEIPSHVLSHSGSASRGEIAFERGRACRVAPSEGAKPPDPLLPNNR